ncbi:MAG TPA: thiamine phosphate synthase [Castellaniella sp.]|uniref:thiamine phosphate synthase n=1 Tax=Castellaniella sp. TaxID=1955812 RepID=UPI002F0A31D4
MNPLRFPRGLYGITPDWDDTERLLGAIEQAHAGGMVALQWRRKHGTQSALRAQAREVHALCLRLGLIFIINDDWRLAADLDADGAHIGRDDGAVAQARQALGADKLLGCSCYDRPDLARERLCEDVDLIAFGAIYPSPTKPEAEHATLDHIRAGHDLVRGLSPRPAVCAIGGLTPENSAAVIAAGADSLAVISAVFEAPDIRAAAQRFSALFL